MAAIRVGTADLLDMLLEEEPHAEFSFAMGADTFMDLTDWKWRRSKDVLQLLDGRFVVMIRRGLAMSKDQVQERLDQLNSSQDTDGTARLLDIPTLSDVSSTKIRASSDTEMLSTMLTPTVLEYIRTRKLYGFTDDTKDGGRNTNL